MINFTTINFNLIVNNLKMMAETLYNNLVGKWINIHIIKYRIKIYISCRD